MELRHFGSLFFMVLTMNLFSVILGGNSNHPTRHHHFDRGNLNFENERNRSLPTTGNRLQRGTLDESIITPSYQKEGEYEVAEGKAGDSLSYTKTFDREETKLLREETLLENLSSNFYFNSTLDENNSIKDRNKSFDETTFSQYYFDVEEAVDENKTKIQPTINLRNERETSNLKFSRETFKEKGKVTAFRMLHSMFDGGQMRSSLHLKSLQRRDDENHSMFTRHNITVESLNHNNDRKRKTKAPSNPDNGHEEQQSGNDATWTVSFSDRKVNLNNTSTKIYAQVGGDALLPCRVGHLGDRQVSWIRRRDWYVLTSGDSLYTHDERFVVLHEEGSQDWTLHIKRAVKGDSGMYECQVSTGTGIISFFVRLEVVTPTAHIPGNGRTHVYRGSPFTIFCYIVKSPSPIQHVMWYHNSNYLNYKRERTDIVITTKTQRSRLKDEEDDIQSDEDDVDALENDPDKNVVISRLKVDFATEEHSGNYTCSAPNVVPDSTLIYVTEGDKTAAVQRIDSGYSKTSPSVAVIYVFVTLTYAAR